MKNDVAIYLRKSREDEELKEETLARHEKMLLDYCARNNLNIVKIYKEVVSGESIANRPEMQRLLDDVANGSYAGVVCVEIERLSRGNQLDQCEILDVFKGSDTKIYTLNKIYDLSKEEIDEEFFEFALFMSRREYKTIKRRLLRGRNHSRNEGYYIGSIVPYGFTKVRQEKGFILVPEEKEIEVVKTIFNKSSEGYGLTAIAHYLNDKGIKPRFANVWADYLVKGVLTNKTYIGLIHSKKNKTWVAGKHKPVIDVDTFELIQARLKGSTRVNNRNTLANPLATLLKCSECGRTLTRAVNGAGVAYLRCVTLKCPNKSAKVEEIEKQLLEEIKEELNGFNYFLDNYESNLKAKRDAQLIELDLLNKELGKKKAMLTRACEMLEEGIYTIEKFKERSASLDSDISSIENKIAEIKEKPIEDDTRVKNAIPKLEKVLKDYHKLDVKGKNLLLKSIVESVEYTKLERNIELIITLLV